MPNVSNSIRQQAKDLGRRARSQMDPLCERHLRELEYHPTHAEFSGTPIYNEFEDLVYDHAVEQGYEVDDRDPTIPDEFRWEVREAFDEGYHDPRPQIECVACLNDDDVDMQIRVADGQSITAENILDDYVQSGNVANDPDDWR